MAAKSLQNRVDPLGAIHANPARGLFMGNRGGKIHDPATKMLLKRRFASRRWIICLTEFKGRKRVLMGNGYTELFFLDEVTALSAGHRPCAECRREDFRRFCAAVAPELGDSFRADALDAKLHGERLGERPHIEAGICSRLPDGAMVALGTQMFARRGSLALAWDFGGYGEKLNWDQVSARNPVLLTPPVSVTALRNGYSPTWHPTAGA